jgi:2-polyprenyl-3-methyl-5-hydroxy-6-metoxy-1,4-benzoquinol methylase
MPSSHTFQLNEIMELVILVDPKSILDIGCGNGKYGLLCYERLNLWDTNNLNNKRVTIDAIEGFKDYITPVHEYIYNKIYINEVFEAFKNINKKYDLILLIDILEHFSREQGERLVIECLEASRNLIISTPKNIGNQKEAFCNPLEVHRTQWGQEEFSQFGNYFIIKNHLSHIVYLGEDLERVRSNSFYFKEGLRK